MVVVRITGDGNACVVEGRIQFHQGSPLSVARGIEQSCLRSREITTYLFLVVIVVVLVVVGLGLGTTTRVVRTCATKECGKGRGVHDGLTGGVETCGGKCG